MTQEHDSTGYVFGKAPDIRYVLDPQGRLTSIDGDALGVLGYEPDELLGRSIFDLVHPDDVEQSRASMAESVRRRDGETRTVEIRLLHRDGSVRHIEIHRRLVFDGDELVRNEGIVSDVTEHKELEHQLNLYREIITNSQDAVVILDTEGRYLEHNPAHEQLLGYTLDELRPRTAARVIGREAYARVLEVLSAGRTYRGEVTATTRAGGQVEVELLAFPVLDAGGRLQCYVGFGRDISARKRAESRRQCMQRAREEVLLMSAAADINNVVGAIGHALDDLGVPYHGCGINVLDTTTDPPTMSSRTSTPEGGWLESDTSRSAGIVLELSRRKGPTYRRDLEEDDPFGELDYMQKRAAIRSVLDVPFARGTLAINSTRPNAYSAEDIAVLQELADVLSDGFRRMDDLQRLRDTVEELEQANRDLVATQTQLIRSEKMAALGSLVAGIAHEINTPVGAIRSMHDTLMKAVEKLRATIEADFPEACGQGGGLEKVLKIIADSNKVIETGSERVTTIVRSLRNFARVDDAQLEDADLHQGLDDSLMLVHHDIKNRIEVVKEYGPIPRVKCYAGRLNQVFLNILNNAQQAIDGAGTITIRTECVGDEVRIAIADTGAGIAPEHIARVFDPGFTTKGVGSGTGLGLAICYQIMQDHHGRIEVASEPGQGATFTIVVPLVPPPE